MCVTCLQCECLFVVSFCGNECLKLSQHLCMCLLFILSRSLFTPKRFTDLNNKTTHLDIHACILLLQVYMYIYVSCIPNYIFCIQWNPNIADTIGELHVGHYRGLAVAEGFYKYYMTEIRT